MATQVIVLNGGSSSGKSEIVRHLQAVLPQPWLATGVDKLIEAMPAAMRGTGGGIEFAAGGAVSVGPDFDRLQAAWMRGVAATARAGAPVIVDDVFLGAAATQRRWRTVLGGLSVLWAGVRCDVAVAVAREAARPDRVPGMAAAQAEVVHQGVGYDVEVDTTATGSLTCARTIAARVGDQAGTVAGDDAGDEAQIRDLIERWARAVHAGDLAGVVADHAGDIVMYDVPPPYQGVRGIDAYRRTWPDFFRWQAAGATFDLDHLQVTAGDTVAYAHALLRCGTPEELAGNPESRLRLTLGLRRDQGRWVVAHEHHSFPAGGGATQP